MHQNVPGVGAQRQLEQRRVVEGDQADGEQAGRRDRVAEPGEHPRVHDGEQPLARATAAVAAGGQGAQGEGDRGAHHEQRRDDHGEGHVTEHVSAEQHATVDARGPAGDPDQQGAAGQPGQRAQQRPTVGANVEPADADQVADGEQDGDREPQQVEPPGAGERAGGQRAGQRVAGDRLGQGDRGWRLVGHRRPARRQRHPQPDGRAHQHQLGSHQPPERPRDPLIEPAEQARPMTPTGGAEQHDEPDLDDDQGAVRGGQASEVADPHQGVDHPRPGDQGEAREGQGREASSHDGQVVAQPRAQQHQGREPTHPDADPDQVPGQAVDRQLVTPGAGRVAGERQRGQRQQGDQRQRPHGGVPGRERATHGDHGGQRRADQQGTQQVDLGGEGGQLIDETRCRDGDAGDARIAQHQRDGAADHPAGRCESRQPDGHRAGPG